jgi:hypothetical protein
MTDLEMKLNRRWGEKYIDNRTWPLYNEQLVKRGEYFLDLEWVKGWNEELRIMNGNKIGRPFEFPNSLITLQAVWHAKSIPVRMIEGITRKLVELAKLPAYNDYSTINRRINRLDVRLNIPEGNDLFLSGDGSGVQAVEGGEYLRTKYGKKNRRWVQIIILGDQKKHEPVSFEVHITPVSEPDSIQRQIQGLRNQGIRVKCFSGDGGFDKIRFWNYLQENRIRPVIKPDKNAIANSKSSWRNLNVRYIKENSYKQWAKATGYGKRWIATEGIFSAIKRIFGEHLVGKTEIGMVQEAKLKIWSYTELKRYGET